MIYSFEKKFKLNTNFDNTLLNMKLKNCIVYYNDTIINFRDIPENSLLICFVCIDKIWENYYYLNVKEIKII